MPIRITPAVKWILIACLAAFVVQHAADQFFGMHLLAIFALVPKSFILDHRFWQIITYAFLHGDPMHLFLNLLMFVFIGGELEALWGTVQFIKYFFICSVSAGVVYLLLQAVIMGGEGIYVPMVGASGAIYGLLIAYGLLFGERVLLFMMLFPMKAKHFVWILAGVEFMTSLFSGRGGLSSAAHLGGMAAGFIYLWGRAAYRVLKRNRQNRPPKAKKRRGGGHLKLIINNEEDRVGERDDDLNGPKTWH